MHPFHHILDIVSHHFVIVVVLSKSVDSRKISSSFAKIWISVCGFDSSERQGRKKVVPEWERPHTVAQGPGSAAKGLKNIETQRNQYFVYTKSRMASSTGTGWAQLRQQARSLETQV